MNKPDMAHAGFCVTQVTLNSEGWLYSLSKAYGFASWRIGYMAVPEALLPSLLKVQDTNLICPPLITQYAAMGALETGSDYCRSRLRKIEHIRKQVILKLRPLSGQCEVTATDGAFYVLLKLNTGTNDLELVKSLITVLKIKT